MDNFTKGALSVIAVSLLAMAVKMWLPGYATLGEFQDIARQGDSESKQSALAAWRGRLLVLRVQGGSIDVDVTRMP